jgi:hypothetical protein
MQKAVFWPLFGVCFEFFCPKNQFVLSLFFGIFVDSKGLSEFVPSILTSFSHFHGLSRSFWAARESPSRHENDSPPRRRRGQGAVGASASLPTNHP